MGGREARGFWKEKDLTPHTVPPPSSPAHGYDTTQSSPNTWVLWGRLRPSSSLRIFLLGCHLSSGSTTWGQCSEHRGGNGTCRGGTSSQAWTQLAQPKTTPEP